MPDAARNALAALSDGYYAVVMALGAAGLALCPRWREPAPALLVALVVYWTLVHLAFFGDPRFHAPIMPVVSIWAGCGAIALWRWAREDERGQAPALKAEAKAARAHRK